MHLKSCHSTLKRSQKSRKVKAKTSSNLPHYIERQKMPFSQLRKRIAILRFSESPHAGAILIDGAAVEPLMSVATWPRN
jgi:hypothetical protein